MSAPNDRESPLPSENLERTPPSSEEPTTSKTTQILLAEEEWERVKQESSEYKDKYLRLLADLENSRKRLQKEKQELIQYAVQNLLVDFLNPIDHMENALKYTQQMSEETRHWAMGFQMILSQFKDVLANHGAQAFSSEGSLFDPHCHEAIEMVETTAYPPGFVVEESIRGYKMGERTIRPARVKVSKEPRQKNAEQPSANKEDL